MKKLYFGTIQILLRKKKEKYSRCIVPEIYYHSVAMTVYFSSFFSQGGGVDRDIFVLLLLLICHLTVQYITIVLYTTFLRGNKR